MDNKDLKSRSKIDTEVSPKNLNYFYFPCGSISSYQESLENNEEEFSEHISIQKSLENEEKNSGIMDFISFDQVSLDKLKFEDTGRFTFTGSFEGSQKFVEFGTNVDTYKEKFDEISLELQEKNKLCQRLLTDIKSIEKAKNDLEKTVKSSRQEIESLKEKLKTQEIDLFKIKSFIEEISDEDQKTSRNNVENIMDKLEAIRSKLKINTSKKSFFSPVKSAVNTKLNFMPECIEDDGIKTERPKSSLHVGFDSERITYKDVLRDLKEITSRASKALKNSTLNRRCANFVPHPRVSVEKTPPEKQAKSFYRNY